MGHLRERDPKPRPALALSDLGIPWCARRLVHVLGALDGGTLRGNIAAVELGLVLLGLLFVGPGNYSVDKN